MAKAWGIFYLALASLVLFAPQSAQFAGGSGTESDPWQVAAAEQLYALRLHPGAHFRQTADIDLGVPPWNTGEGWQPCDFTGVYDGGGYTVSNLTLNRPEGYLQGLFARVFGSVRNLNLTAGEVCAAEYAGLLAGYLDQGLIHNCAAEGSVSGSGWIGGLVGEVGSKGTVSGCRVLVTVVASIGNAGGLAAHNAGRIARASASGGIDGDTAGGIAGVNSGLISDCHSSADIGGCQAAGGLVGINSGTLLRSYSRGLVCGNCAGGLVAVCQDIGEARHCYWDIEAAGTCWSEEGEGRGSAMMVYPHDANTFVNWDWRVWQPDVAGDQNSGYPFLRAPDYAPQNVPEPALPVGPEDLAQGIGLRPELEWRTGFAPLNTNAPDGFRLWLGTDYPPSNLCAGLDLGLAYSFTPPVNLPPDTACHWQIVPYNEIGQAVGSPVWSFSTRSLASLTPATVQGLGMQVVNGALQLNWVPVDCSDEGTPLQVSGYRVFGCGSPDAPAAEWTSLAFVTGETVLCLDPGICPDRMFFRVVAVAEGQ